jgi:hypothetical protein
MKISISKIKPNPDNPRIIKDDKFKKLVQSLKDFPEMTEVRPIVVNKEMMILGGNMRLKAMQEAEWKDVPVTVVDWPAEKQKEFIIKDNSNFGEWDWETLTNEWDEIKLKEWGLDLPEWHESEPLEPSGYDSQPYWFLNIKFENELECQKWYEKLLTEGLDLKIVQ